MPTMKTMTRRRVEGVSNDLDKTATAVTKTTTAMTMRRGGRGGSFWRYLVKV